VRDLAKKGVILQSIDEVGWFVEEEIDAAIWRIRSWVTGPETKYPRDAALMPGGLPRILPRYFAFDSRNRRKKDRYSTTFDPFMANSCRRFGPESVVLLLTSPESVVLLFTSFGRWLASCCRDDRGRLSLQLKLLEVSVSRNMRV
jgi:hypothetical protein